jgi:hypothetical protein
VGQKVAIVLSANDTLLGKLLEDALAIQLSNVGYEVVPREKLESVLARQMAADSTNETALSTLDLARAVNANLVITGVAFVGTSDFQPIMVVAASLQLLDVSTGKYLVQTLFEDKDGIRLTATSKSFLEVINAAKK